jgi:hypothetical protein
MLKLVLKSIGILIVIASSVMVIGAIWFSIIFNGEAQIHCDINIYNSAECKDLSIARVYMLLIGGIAAGTLTIAAGLLLRYRNM